MGEDVGSGTASYRRGDSLHLVVALPAATAPVATRQRIASCKGEAALHLLNDMRAAQGRPSLFALSAEPEVPAERLALLTVPPDDWGDPLASAMALVETARAMFPESIAIYWPPGHLWSRFDAEFTSATIADMQRACLPPVMHLIAFAVAQDSQGIIVASRGLALFSGAELRLIGPSSLSARDALRTVARLAIDAMLQRGPAGPMIVDGLNKGERLRLGAPIVEDGGRVIPVEWIPPGH